jgi:hypothetical protein
LEILVNYSYVMCILPPMTWRHVDMCHICS